ncbi:MAG: hypothetical protein E7583_08220 [Ruminococcaceae bacterium]|nr:hypothetical protein [Oscillospiraceae bacterium]
MINATKEFLDNQEKLYEARKQEILGSKDDLTITGTTYYVSTSGDDANDGLTPEKAWKTPDRVTNAELCAGDGVLFRRGDLFRGGVNTKPGVTYGAYGEGAKPEFRGWDENLAGADKWELADADHNIWKYKRTILDPGTLVFNEGEKHSVKLIPTYKNSTFVCRDDESKIFVMADEMVRDLDMFWYFDRTLTKNPTKGEDFPIPVTGEESFGDLYLRCDAGNPGEVFDSIEAIARRVTFRVGTNANVHIDNICMKYYCFGVSAGGHSVGLHVTNCEIGWIGGNIQHYFGTDPNYPQGTRGSVTRFGNAIEIYGGCDDYEVSNCYIYESYDAGMTHQVTTWKKVTMHKIRYLNNLVEKCVYGVEYFLDQKDGESESCMDDVVMDGNIIRLSGYGWGQQRHNYYTPALIKGWSYVNTARNYSITNNIFDRSAYRMLHVVSLKDESKPTLDGNTFIQNLGGMIGQIGGNENGEPETEIFDEKAEEKINNIFGDKNAKVYIIK